MIALSEPNLSGNEWKYIKECLDTNWVSSVGSYVTLFEKKVAEFCGVNHAIATCNGTSALHIALMLAGVTNNDLVIAPNITFVASINSIKYCGADPILMDIDASSWQMDLDLLEEFLHKETALHNSRCIFKKNNRIIKAIMPVHVLGNICDMDRLMDLANKYHLQVIEDATEALGSYYKNKHAGSFGNLSCLSFNGNKIITTGGGGMIITNDEMLAKKAKHVTTQAKASPTEYYHDEVGYNYRLVNILAAMGVAQMEQLPGFIKRKKEIGQFYKERLEKIPGVVHQGIAPDVNANNWLYTVNVPKQAALRKYLRENEIDARPFWVPMNQLPFNNGNTYYTRNDHSKTIYEQCLSLPCSTHIQQKELDQVVNTFKAFYSA